MANLIKATCRLTLDNPDADGRIETMGAGHDWPGVTAENSLTGFTPDATGAYGWLTRGQFEDCPQIRGLMPFPGGVVFSDMVLADWTVNSGLWQESPTAVALNKKFLHFYDGRTGRVAADAYGDVTSKNDYGPNMAFEFLQVPAHPQDTDPRVIAIAMEGTGADYLLTLPLNGQTDTQTLSGIGSGTYSFTNPMLWGLGDDTEDWVLIAEHKTYGMPQRFAVPESQGFQVQFVTIEYIDGWLVVKSSDWAHDIWVYQGTWADSSGNSIEFGLGAGKVRVMVTGHTALFNVKDLAYPASVTVDAANVHYTSPRISSTPHYKLIKHEPTGATVSVAEHPDAVPGYTRPRLTFAATDTSKRAVVYTVQEYREPTFSAANSSETQSNDSNFCVMSATGSCNDTWRGATMTAEVETHTSASLPTIKPNAKVKCEIDRRTGAEAPTYYTQFTGYVVPPETEKYTVNQIRATIRAEDGIEARLSKKQMLGQCSFEGWPLADAFEYMLNCAGVPDSLISVDAGITGDAYNLPLSDPPGTPLFKFMMDEHVINALDIMAESRDCEWGVNSSGTYFLRPRSTHTSGYSDWTLDGDTTTDEDAAVSFRACDTMDDFCNHLLVIAGQGWSATGHLIVDWASATDSSDSDYIADIWNHVELRPDGDDAQQIAERLWARKHELRNMIFFTLRSQPDLMPGQYVKVQVADVGVPTDSIYRITNKNWRVGPKISDFEQAFEAVLVEEGS